MLISIFESSPVDERVGPAPVAALATVNSFTAELVAVSKANSFPLVSKIDVPIFGEVKVLLVKVSVPVSVTSPAGKVSISGLVPSFPVANTRASPLFPAAKVKLSPDPEAYLNCTVCDPDVEFLKK